MKSSDRPRRRPLLALALGCALVSPLAVAEIDIDMEAVERAKRDFVERMVSEHGFEAADVERTLDDAEILRDILDTISRPAERVLPWHEYRAIFVTPERIAAGVEYWREHADLLASVSAQYGVAPEIIVAILGVETYYGQRMGSHRVLDALATLSFAYPPRARFFASQLEEFLVLGREEGLGLLDELGSYAGAMGAGQFIPTSFSAYAVDANDDGRRDLWHDPEDILASVANYLAEHHWRTGERVAERVSLGDVWSGHEPENDRDLDYTVESLRGLGYELPADRDGAAKATILGLEGPDGTTEYWVGYHNFRVITRYNISVMYALAVHELGRAIARERGAAIEQPRVGAGGEIE